ncbi:MAG TPA: ABC transporter substrate-binding protein [Opitutaceae bacterium]|jgi:iron complex transport system substrate-binding protein
MASLMRTWLAALLLLPLGAAGAAGVRIVSQTVGTDEALLAVADPGQIAALSPLAHNPEYSAVAREAKPYPELVVNGDAESVLKFRPSVVLCADYSRVELVSQLRTAGVRVIVFNHYATLQDSYEMLRRIAAEVGAPERAEAVIAECERRTAALRERLKGIKPVRVISPSTYDIIPGDHTTFQDLCDHAGAENLAATLGQLHGNVASPDEQMLAWPIDEVVVSGTDRAAALAPYRKLPPYEFMAAVRDGRAALMEPWMLGCVSFRRVDAYFALARALHPEAWR